MCSWPWNSSYYLSFTLANGCLYDFLFIPTITR